jgi:hypothetical protein
VIAIAPTHQSWFNQLRSRPHGKIVNFWTPTPWNVRQMKPGDRLYFLLKAPIRKIAGFGHFVSYENMSASAAWNRFGLDKGALSVGELVQRTGELSAKNTQRAPHSPETEIGCILLSSPMFAPEADWIEPATAGLSFPKQVVKLKYFPKMSSISQLSAASPSSPTSLDKAMSFTIEVQDGQAFASDAAIRKAIETRAMALAKEYYAQMFDEVQDTSATESYDLRCTRAPLEVRVEVKGSTGAAEQVFITGGELTNARNRAWRTDLFVVSAITLKTDASGTRGEGGTIRVINAWKPADSDLTPVAFRYRLPG